MKSLLMLLVASVLSLTASAQKPYDISKDEQTGSLIFKGPITIADLQTEPSFKWMNSNYKPDAATIAALKQALPGHKIVTVIGTWCDDSQSFMPKLVKVLEETAFPAASLSLWGVDRTKESGREESKVYGVKMVPTVIVFKVDQEIGRIVESPKKSIEADLLQIIQKG